MSPHKNRLDPKHLGVSPYFAPGNAQDVFLSMEWSNSRHRQINEKAGKFISPMSCLGGRPETAPRRRLKRRRACSSPAAKSHSWTPKFWSVLAPRRRKLNRLQLFSKAMAARGMARETGLEPATSGVTGRRSNQLSYSPAARRRDGRGETCRIDRREAPPATGKVRPRRKRGTPPTIAACHP